MSKCHTSDSNLGKGSVYFAVREVVLSECVNIILVVLTYANACVQSFAKLLVTAG